MQKVLLMILDGLGVSALTEGNAIKAADMPFFKSLMKTCPNTLLHASGEYVGLPKGIMGNSEVGHENIGAGRIVKQKLTAISDLAEDGTFFRNKILLEAFQHAKKHGSKLHLMGLISEGDVHAHLGHLEALIEMARREGLDMSKLFLHAISDGRDDPPYAAEPLMKHCQEKIQIATVSGRYWAMDRDNNWDRIQKYLDCVINSQGLRADSAAEAISRGYVLAKSGGNSVGDSDEFILPTVIDDRGSIADGDSVIFFNFRPDRARQISRKLALESGFKDFLYTCFTTYSDDLDLPVAFTEENLPSQDISLSLGELVANAGMRQFRIAETEKFNHVTSFFNVRSGKAFAREDRMLIPSPKVATYDLKPEMSVYEVAESLCRAIAGGDLKELALQHNAKLTQEELELGEKERVYDLIVCNFANPDMLGHTGKWDAVLEALYAVDKALEQVVTKAKEAGYVILITADHGNADQMQQDDGSIRTAHSCNQVPFIVVNSEREIRLKQSDNLALANIAPTIVSYLGLEQASSMSAESLIR